MVKKLQYIDGTSDKFWQITVDGNKHTVTYGRNGSAGQSKTKTFSTAEDCLADAEKLYREKIKKGYSEDGSVTPAAKEAAGSRPATPAAQNKQAAIDAYDQLIRTTDIDGLIPFLDTYAMGNMETLKKEVKKAKRYWMSYVDLSKDPIYGNKSGHLWGTRGSTQQHYLIKLSALALFSLSDTTNWPELIELLDQPKDPNVQKVLQWAKPTWLAECLQQLQAKNEFIRLDYPNLRLLEAQGYMTFLPEVYARSISRYVDWGTTAGERQVNFIAADELAYSRDVPLVFEYETGIHDVYSNYNYRNKEESVLLWDQIFDRLLADGHIDKEFILKGCLQVQTKNWNNNLKSYFRKLIGRLELGTADILEHQHDFFPLLHAEHNAVVKFVIDTLKPYFGEDGFDMEAFLTWAEPVFMRSDVKGGVKTLLVQLDKLVKKQPELREPINERVADVFMIPDLDLQERAAKFLQKHTTEDSASVGEKLMLYAPQMLGTIAADLKDLISTAGLTEEEVLAPLTEERDPYVLNPAEPVRLDEARRITYPSDWNAILFQVGNVLGTDNPVESEILLHAWMTHRALIPADAEAQLDPYEKQLEAYRPSVWFSLFKSEFSTVSRHPESTFRYIHKDDKESHLVITLLDIFDLVRQRVRDGITLPLLSVPTHAPFWVAPEVLVDRIIMHEQHGQQVNLNDLAIALCRMPREHVDAAKPKLAEIQDEQVRQLLAYALGLSDTIAVRQKEKTWWKAAFSSGRSNAEVSNWEALWALVARTHHPDGIFEEFNTGILAGVPFAAAPYRPAPTLEPLYYSEYNYDTEKSEQVYQGDIVALDFPKLMEVPSPFLYGKDIFSRAHDSNWYVDYIGREEVTYMHSLTPQNPEPVALYLTMAFNRGSDWDTRGGSQLLREMLYDFYRFDPASNLFLATSLFNISKEMRAVAGEVLMQSIDENRLPVDAIGKHAALLISHQYGPVKRLVEVLESVRDVSHKHNDALFQLLTALLQTVALGDKMPTNFKKLLELYFDLKTKLDGQVDNELKAALTGLSRFKALQPIINKILK